MMYEDEGNPAVFDSGVPVDLCDIQCDGDFDDDYGVVPVDRVNSFTAPQDEEVVWRGYAAVAQPSPFLVGKGILAEDLSALKRGEIGKPSLSRKLEIDIVASPPSFAEATAKPSFADDMKTAATAPATPFLLMDTHFFCNVVDLNSVVNRVEEELNNIPEVAREFDNTKCSWSTICADTVGSARCHMNVHIYKAKKNLNRMPFIVECNRMQGDHAVFRRIFGLLAEALSDDVNVSPTSVMENTPDLLRHGSSIGYDSPVDFDGVSAADEEEVSSTTIAEAVNTVTSMAYEPRQESRLLAARLLCDFTASEMLSCDTSLCSSLSVIQALLKLAQGNPELHRENEVRYCAFLALSNLSRGSVSTKTALINAGAVPVIIAAIDNGTYQDAHIRRECASMLSNLSTGNMAKKVVSVLGYNKVNSLFPVIDGLTDERMKLHAMMAKDSLMNACIPVG